MDANRSRPRVVLAGGSGFIGSALAPVLVAKGYDVTILGRGADRAADGRETDPIRHVQWDACTPGPCAAELDGAAAVVNLVGKSVDCRKTEANRRGIPETPR